MGVSLRKVPTEVEEAAVILPVVILPVTDTLAADTVPVATSEDVVVVDVTTKFVVETEASPPIVLDKPKVMSPSVCVEVRLVSDRLTEVTPVFTMVMVPPVVEEPRPTPTATFDAVKDDASVNTLVKFS